MLSLYQVDAFAARPFEGNPAAVIPLDRWLTDAQMQAIALENNLSETAFFVPDDDGFAIRWFTPTVEVDLCGHATLASAHVLFSELGLDRDAIRFNSRSGPLSVSRNGSRITLDFPLQTPLSCATPDCLVDALERAPVATFKFDDYVLVYDDEEFVRHVSPDLRRLAEAECRGVIVTAASSEYDFVCRLFAPRCGVDEDPVTGSAFTQLAPVWRDRLSKAQFSARQVSARGGDVDCAIEGDRVLISGRAVTYMTGTIDDAILAG